MQVAPTVNQIGDAYTDKEGRYNENYDAMAKRLNGVRAC